MENPSPPPRRWWKRIRVRLSVRMMMAVVLVIGGGLGWVVHLAHVQRDAKAAIERAGGKAYYGWQLRRTVTPDYEDLGSNNPGARPPWPKWLVDRIGPDYYSTVKLVSLSGPADPVMPHVGRLRDLEEIDFFPRRNDPAHGPTDAGMVHLRGMNRLKHLMLGVNRANRGLGAKITGAGLASIAGATRLQILNLHGVPLTDPDLAALRGLTDLRVLEIESPGVTDAGLTHLANLVELRTLSLQGTRVTSAGIVHLRNLTRLHQLNLALTQVDRLESCRGLPALTQLILARTPITDDGLALGPEPGFAALTSLNLFRTRVGDEGLKYLRGLPKLRRVEAAGTAVTDAGVLEFREDRQGVSVNIIDRAAVKGVSAMKAPGPAGK